jgi:hypothetical protein
MCRCGIKLQLDGDAARCAACGSAYRMHSGVLAPAQAL